MIENLIGEFIEIIDKKDKYKSINNNITKLDFSGYNIFKGCGKIRDMNIMNSTIFLYFRFMDYFKNIEYFKALCVHIYKYIVSNKKKNVKYLRYVLNPEILKIDESIRKKYTEKELKRFTYIYYKNLIENNENELSYEDVKVLSNLCLLISYMKDDKKINFTKIKKFMIKNKNFDYSKIYYEEELLMLEIPYIRGVFKKENIPNLFPGIITTDVTIGEIENNILLIKNLL
jgi:hypothetical protein